LTPTYRISDPLSQQGVGNGTISGNIFAPREIVVPVGSTVTWTVTSGEAHTVTFPPQKVAPPDGPPPSWPVMVQAGGAAQFDGGALVNSGIIFRDAQVNVTFTEAGTFSYICALHPGIQGVVKVVGPGEAYTAAAEAAATAQQESEAVLAPVEGLRQERNADFVQTQQADGATLWNVPVGALTNTPVGPLEILEYFPSELRIKAGDTVRWTANAPHTVTFLSGQELPIPPSGDPVEIPAAKPSDSYTGQGFYHSGAFAFGPGAPTEFQLTFPQPGVFPYTCALHGRIGHNGVVIVEP
jgi:plastocyanin